MSDWPGFVLITDPDEPEFGRYGRVEDARDGAIGHDLWLIRFSTGEGRPRAWYFPEQFEPLDSIPSE